MRNIYLIGGLVFLVVIIVSGILGFSVIKNRQKQPQGGQAADSNVTSPGGQPAWISSLEGDEKEIFNVPTSTTSDEDKEKYSILLTKNALESNQLLITSTCRPIPLVLAVSKTNYQVEVKNDDSQSHTIYLSENEGYEINAGQTTTINLETKKGTIANYTCDQYGTVGFFAILS